MISCLILLNLRDLRTKENEIYPHQSSFIFLHSHASSSCKHAPLFDSRRLCAAVMKFLQVLLTSVLKRCSVISRRLKQQIHLSKHNLRWLHFDQLVHLVS